jgi:hypothetical protein
MVNQLYSSKLGEIYKIIESSELKNTEAGSYIAQCKASGLKVDLTFLIAKLEITSQQALTITNMLPPAARMFLEYLNFLQSHINNNFGGN